MAIFTEEPENRIVHDAARSLVAEFGPILGEDAVVREIEAAYRYFDTPLMRAYLPLLTQRKARERLLALSPHH